MIEKQYEIESVVPADPPADMEGTNWHCYVIVQGSNKIRGYRQGSRKAVTTAVQEIVAQLNERRFGKRGRVQASSTAVKKPEDKKPEDKKPASK
jgi:hypothetical protein